MVILYVIALFWIMCGLISLFQNLYEILGYLDRTCDGKIEYCATLLATCLLVVAGGFLSLIFDGQDRAQDKHRDD